MLHDKKSALARKFRISAKFSKLIKVRLSNVQIAFNNEKAYLVKLKPVFALGDGHFSNRIKPSLSFGNVAFTESLIVSAELCKIEVTAYKLKRATLAD